MIYNISGTYVASIVFDLVRKYNISRVDGRWKMQCRRCGGIFKGKNCPTCNTPAGISVKKSEPSFYNKTFAKLGRATNYEKGGVTPKEPYVAVGEKPGKKNYSQYKNVFRKKDRRSIKGLVAKIFIGFIIVSSISNAYEFFRETRAKVYLSEKKLRNAQEEIHEAGVVEKPEKVMVDYIKMTEEEFSIWILNKTDIKEVGYLGMEDLGVNLEEIATIKVGEKIDTDYISFLYKYKTVPNPPPKDFIKRVDNLVNFQNKSRYATIKELKDENPSISDIEIDKAFKIIRTNWKLNAMNSANRLIKSSYVSRATLALHLLDKKEYGFEAEEVDFVLDKLEIDFKRVALNAARLHFISSSSEEETRRYLGSNSVGGKFTKEEVDYAMKRLDK